MASFVSTNNPTTQFRDAVPSSRLARRAHDPVRELVARLGRIDGHLWLELMLDTGPTAQFGGPRSALCDGRASLEEMRMIKRECKRYLKTSADSEIRLGALAGYMMVVAAALVHYRRLICQRSRAELEPMFLDLAEVAPRAWSVLLMQAAVVPVRPASEVN